MIEGMPHVPAGISVLQSPGEYLIQSGSGNYSQLAKLRDCTRELPTGDARAHPTLNDFRVAALRKHSH